MRVFDLFFFWGDGQGFFLIKFSFHLQGPDLLFSLDNQQTTPEKLQPT